MHFLIIILTLIFIYLANDFIKKNSIKSEFGIALPIIGHLYKVANDKDRKNVHRFNNGIFKLWSGDRLVFVINEPKVARDILVDNFENFSNRAKIPALAKYSNQFKGISFSDIETWSRFRPLVSLETTKTKLISNHSELFEENTKQLISNLKLKKDGIFNPRIEFSQFLMNIIGIINLDDTFWWLSPFYYFINKTTQSNIKELNNHIENYYNEHIENLDYNNPKDFMDILIISTNGKEKEQVIQVSLEIINAGTDPCQALLQWICIYLANNQNVQQKAYNEIINVIGKDCSFIHLKYRSNCKFILAIIKETLRIRPIAPLGVPYTVVNDTIINNIFYPKDSYVILNLFGICNNPNHFNQPNHFLPERWIENDNLDSNFIPFSVGRRQCAGINYSEIIVFLALSNIILNFEIFSTNGNKIDDSENFGATLEPNHFNIKLKPRFQK
ncbi:hypothetical protein ACTA71_000854 [Dictyostelium dimigraforme]